MISSKELLDIIESKRIEKGENKTAFYTNCGVGRSFPDNLKKGQMPSFDKVCAVADYLEIPVDSLIIKDDTLKKLGWSPSDMRATFVEVDDNHDSGAGFKIGIDLGNAETGIIAQKLPVKTTRSEMFEILSKLTDEELENLLNYAQFLIAKRHIPEMIKNSRP